ncbi:hypothetical protein [Lacticaseibacillus pantheris]|jgi:hypothetical protein
MTLTTITHAGQASGWLGQINTALDALNNAQTDTGWTQAGITSVNGTDMGTDDYRLHYRTVTVGSVVLTLVTGRLDFPVAVGTSDTTLYSLPTSAFPKGIQSENAHLAVLSGSGKPYFVTINDDGSLTVKTLSGSGAAANSDSIYVHIIAISK